MGGGEGGGGMFCFAILRWWVKQEKVCFSHKMLVRYLNGHRNVTHPPLIHDTFLAIDTGIIINVDAAVNAKI